MFVVPDDGKPRQLSAAQKKREKLKLKKQLAKQAEADGDGDAGADGTEGGAAAAGKEEDADGVNKNKKKTAAAGKDKGKDVKGKTKGPSKAQIAAIQAAIQKAKEEEERLLREEEEKERQRDEAEAARQAKLREEQERKEKKKQKEKERRARLKEEGKLLTPKQRQERERARQLLESLKAQGAPIPDAEAVERKPRRLGTRVRSKHQKKEGQTEEGSENNNNEDATELENQTQKLTLEEQQAEEEKVKDAWDESEEEDGDEDGDEEKVGSVEDDQSAGESSDGDENETELSTSPAREPRVKEEPSVRIEKRRQENERNKDPNILRSPVVCVLGHVDTGKTKILDKLRRTHVQDGEAGGITQQIGATNVPIQAIKDAAKFVKNFSDFDVKVPGLLLIDTPGHESFQNLRSRGSSLCDIAILVVDIMHGLEPQTIESLNLLRKKETPFVVALNKIDRIYDWNPNSKRDIREGLKAQGKNSLSEFQTRANQVIVEFAEQGLNAALFYENSDPAEYISLVPTSALTGEGMGNLMALIVEYAQNMCNKRLIYSEELQGTVLEVKAIPGVGTTVDVVLVNGKLREGDTLVLAGTEGPIVTQIRALLTPQPMKELRVKGAYIEHKEISGAVGVKIAAKHLETAIAGLNVLVACHSDEVDCCKERISRELERAIRSFRLQERGVYVQASTLGSLEALLEFLKTSSIPVSSLYVVDLTNILFSFITLQDFDVFVLFCY